MKKKLLKIVMSLGVIAIMNISLLGTNIVHAAANTEETNALAQEELHEDETLSGTDSSSIRQEIKENVILNVESAFEANERVAELSDSREGGRSSSNSVTQQFIGTIDSENGLSYAIITLAPGEILQAI